VTSFHAFPTAPLGSSAGEESGRILAPGANSTRRSTSLSPRRVLARTDPTWPARPVQRADLGSATVSRADTSRRVGIPARHSAPI